MTVKIPKGGRPDGNACDMRVRVGRMCLIYGITYPPMVRLNGKICKVIDISKDNTTRFLCKVKDEEKVFKIPHKNLTVLDLNDNIVISKYRCIN